MSESSDASPGLSDADAVRHLMDDAEHEGVLVDWVLVARWALRDDQEAMTWSSSTHIPVVQLGLVEYVRLRMAQYFGGGDPDDE